jgi:threonine aldolase
MRQAGILAAAGIVALQTMTGRLADDHIRAKMMAAGLAAIGGLVFDAGSPFTNMIFVNIDNSIQLKATQIAELFKNKGVLVGIVGERRFRLVTHYWVDDAAVQHVIKAWQEIYRNIL